VPTRRDQGSIATADFPGVLLSLHGERATGCVRVERDEVQRALFLSSGWIVDADSSAPTDALEWLLFNAGMLAEERLGQVRSLIASGVRRGRALVELGAVTPSLLCEWSERRARFLAADTLRWRAGEWSFDDGAAPAPGSIGARLDTRSLALDALREGVASLSGCFPSPDEVPALPGEPLEGLLAHERYVMSLADGRRRVSEICFLSEIGETETLRTLALLRQAGCIVDAREGAPLPREEPARDAGVAGLLEPLEVPAGETPAEMRAAVRIYNDVYAGLCAYLIKEVGPIAEQLLERQLRDARDQHAALFSRAVPARDGSLPEDQLMRNVNTIRDQNRRDALLAGLRDYLRAMVTAVRRILGPEHEAQVLRRLKELRCSRT
jgi:hypothetical protein